MPDVLATRYTCSEGWALLTVLFSDFAGVDPNILASSRRLEPDHLVRLSNRLGTPCAHCAFVGATEVTLQVWGGSCLQ